MVSLRRLTSSCICIALCSFPSTARTQDLLHFVNPLIGTVNGGHVFAGATLPFGMAKAVADVTGENQAGFASDNSSVTGFSHLHDSGTGGSSSLGNFPIFPYRKCPGNDIARCSFDKYTRRTKYIYKSVKATPGYFALDLISNVRAEMTISSHAAIYRFTSIAPAPKKARMHPLMLVDLTDLQGSRSQGYIQVDPQSGRISGSGRFSPSFGVGSYQSYFCADFHGAPVLDTGTFRSDTPSNVTSNLTVQYSPISAGAWVRFRNAGVANQIYARVGVSFISMDQACSNGEREIAAFAFNKTLAVAQQAWRDKLNVIKVSLGGASNALKTVFYSGIYRSLISPQDYTGENPLWASTEPYYDSYYCIWDSFRSAHPLITLIDQVSQSRMVRSLIDIYRNLGWLPDCRMSLCKGFTQGGSNADILLTDSYLKSISMGVDWTTAYEAVVKDAEVQPFDWGEEGRGALASWKSLGYVPKNEPVTGDGLRTRSISRTVEYAYDDFCIAEMALSMGLSDDYEKYINRSGNWLNLFKPTQQSLGFTGFLQPKFLNQSFSYQNPTLCSPLNHFDGCYLSSGGHETYEGSCWLYTFFVPGDMAALISALGGAEMFVKRLDYLHESGLLYMGDEQAFLTVFLYHYAGRPGLSAMRSHTYIPSQFNTTVVGIPGNDDSGAMGSFPALSMLGLFPNPGQNVYLITPPYFESVSLRNNQTGNTATIRNTNFDPTYKNIFIQSAKLNGRPYQKNWIDHSFFLNGDTLELVLGGEESDWGTADADLPPSLSTTGVYI